MATAVAAKRHQGLRSSSGKARTRTASSCAARSAPAARPWSAPACAARASWSPRSRSAAPAAARSIKQKDIAIFTRQLATMMKAGVPLLQAFDIVARGSTNPRMTRLLTDIRSDVETGTSLSAAFRKHPLHFDALYCNLVEAGEAGGILEALLDRLAIYQEKTMAHQEQDQVGADLPDRRAGGRLRRADGHHDLRDPGLQGRVHAPSAPTCPRRRCSSSRCPSSSSATGGRSSASWSAACTSSSSRGSAPRRCRWHGPPAAEACRSSAT